jgi:hypothetical protein
MVNPFCFALKKKLFYLVNYLLFGQSTTWACTLWLLIKTTNLQSGRNPYVKTRSQALEAHLGPQKTRGDRVLGSL